MVLFNELSHVHNSVSLDLCCFFAVVLFRSREHENCGPQPGYVRAHVESKYSAMAARILC